MKLSILVCAGKWSPASALPQQPAQELNVEQKASNSVSDCCRLPRCPARWPTEDLEVRELEMVHDLAREDPILKAMSFSIG